MVANPDRRQALLDSALEVLGREGGRGLTHRAVDAEAGVPAGTCANYYSRRADLMEAMAGRLFDRLAPQPDSLARLDGMEGVDAVVGYMRYVVERLLADTNLTLAFFELRLAAARDSAVFDRLAPFLREGFEADVAFHESRGLPGGRDAVVALHHAVNGLLWDHLTVPLQPDADPAEVVERLTRRLL